MCKYGVVIYQVLHTYGDLQLNNTEVLSTNWECQYCVLLINAESMQTVLSRDI